MPMTELCNVLSLHVNSEILVIASLRHDTNLTWHRYSFEKLCFFIASWTCFEAPLWLSPNWWCKIRIKLIVAARAAGESWGRLRKCKMIPTKYSWAFYIQARAIISIQNGYKTANGQTRRDITRIFMINKERDCFSIQMSMSYPTTPYGNVLGSGLKNYANTAHWLCEPNCDVCFKRRKN